MNERIEICQVGVGVLPGSVGQWFEETGASISAQILGNNWEVEVAWCKVLHYSDKGGTHKQTWSVKRYDVNFVRAVCAAIEAAREIDQKAIDAETVR